MHSAQFPYSVSEWTTLCAVGYDFSFFYRVSSFEWTSHWYFSSMNGCQRELSRGNYGGCRWRRKTVSGGVGETQQQTCTFLRMYTHNIARTQTHTRTHTWAHIHYMCLCLLKQLCLGLRSPTPLCGLSDL